MIADEKPVLTAVLVALLAGCATPVPRHDLSYGVQGKIHFESTSPYVSREILDGTDNDSRVTVSGTLVLPDGTQGRVPAMVIVHGSGGPYSLHVRYARELNQMGIATFRTDSFAGRGVRSTIGDQTRVTAAMMTADAYNALKLLAGHPRIDAGRIGILGFSKGGIVALNAAWAPIRKTATADGLGFALHVAFYPICTRFDRLEMTGAPIRVLIGEADDWTPAAPCIAFGKSLEAAGFDVDVQVYPGAHHGFDGKSPVTRYARGFNTTKCRFAMTPDGVPVELTSELPLDSPENRVKALRSCATRGVTVGADAKARKQAMAYLKAFVADRFELRE